MPASREPDAEGPKSAVGSRQSAVGTDPTDPSDQSQLPTADFFGRAIPWFAANGVLLLILSQLRLPAGLHPGLVLAASLAVSIAVIFLACACLYAVSRERLAPRELALLFLVGALFFLATPGFDYLWRSTHPAPAPASPVAGVPPGTGSAEAPAVPVPEGTPAPRVVLDLLTTISSLGVLCLGAAIGSTVAVLIRDRNILLPAGVFAAFADYFMVRFGTVHHAMQSEQGRKVMQTMSATVPAVHQSLAPTTMGMADFVFLAFFFTCAWRFRMNPRATFYVLVAVLALLLFSIPWLRAFPAVAPMALGFVLVNLRHFKLTRAEIHATALVFVMMSALVGLFFWLR